MSKNNLNDNSIDYPEMLQQQNSIPSSSSYPTEGNNTIGKSDEERSLRPPPPMLPLAPPVVSLTGNNSIDTHIVAASSPTSETTSKEPKETENVLDSPHKEYFLDASFGPTPSSYYFRSDNYQNFDEELYTFEQFLGAPDTPKEEGEKNNSRGGGEFDSIPLDSPRAGPSVERNNPISLKIRERSYTPDIGDDDSIGFPFQSHSRQSNTNNNNTNGDETTSTFTTSTTVNPLPIADFSYVEAHQASPEPLNLGPLPLPLRNQSTTNIGSDEMGFLRIFCCLRPQNRASRYHVASEESHPVAEELQQTRPQYSWDLKKANPSDYTFSGRKSEVIIKKNNEIKGQQFVIDNCTDCVVILLDHSGAITVDDAKDSLFVFGPCSGSVFIRNCTNCYFYSICKQFRVRDSNIVTHLFSATPPVIEESKVDFFPLYMNYENLDEHMIEAGLSPFYNCWSQVYDFTPDKNALHFRINYESPETEVADKLELIASSYQLTFVRDNSYFIVSELGKTIRMGDEIGIVIHKKDDPQSDLKTFFNRTRDFALNVLQDPSIILINTTDLEVQKGDLQSSLPHGLKLLGHIVVLEFTGKNCCKVIAETITKFTKDENKKGSFEIIQQNFKENLYRFAEMKRSV